MMAIPAPAAASRRSERAATGRVSYPCNGARRAAGRRRDAMIEQGGQAG